MYKSFKATMLKYKALTSCKIQETMTFRFGFFTSFIASLVQTFVMLYVWNEVFSQKQTIMGFDKSQMLTYLVVSQCLNAIYGWYNATERNISARIKSGDIVLDLVKPINFNFARFYEGIGMTIIQIIFSGCVLLLFIVFNPSVATPTSFMHFIAFLLSAFFGYVSMFSISLITGLLSFVISGYWGLYYLKKAIIDLLSGALIPIGLLPLVLQRFADYLPFKNIIYTPTMIYMGRISINEIVEQMSIQVIWAFILWQLCKYFYRIMIRRVTINGG